MTNAVTYEGVTYDNHHQIWSISSDWNSVATPVGYTGDALTSGNDWIQVGSAGCYNSWYHRGDIWSQSGSMVTVDTGAGDDRIDLGVGRGCGMMAGDSVVIMGEGNDILNVKDNIHDNGHVVMGVGEDKVTVGEDIDDSASVYMGEGNDSLWVGEDIENNATVELGEGDDTLTVGRYLLNNAYVNADAGNDVMTVGQGVHCSSKIYMGAGNDSLSVGEDIDDKAYVALGDGHDTLVVGEDVENFAVIDLGAGRDVLEVAGNIEDCAVVRGDGSIVIDVFPWVYDGNTITVEGYVQNHAQVLLDKGNDVATVKGVNNDAFMSFAAGDDTLTITHEFGHGCGSATVDMGTGDDVVNYGGKTLDGVINGGEGNDTLVLTYDADSSLTSNWCHVTNLSTENIKGVETVKMDGINTVDVRYSDLLADETREGALKIQGDSNDKVDLGSTNWNSDTSWWGASMTDNSAQCGTQWSKTGTATDNGVSYDVYQNSLAGGDSSNDVWVQQGVMVI